MLQWEISILGSLEQAIKMETRWHNIAYICLMAKNKILMYILVFEI